MSADCREFRRRTAFIAIKSQVGYVVGMRLRTGFVEATSCVRFLSAGAYVSAILIYLIILGVGSFESPVQGAEVVGSEAELAHFRRLINVRPEDIQANMHYQDLMIRADRRRELLTEYLKRLQARPGSAVGLYLYGRLLTRPDERLEYLRRSIRADPRIFHARVDLGRTHYHKGDYDAALAQYRSALELKPGSAFVRNLMGLAYYHKGYADQAVAEYKRAVRLNDKFTDAYLNLGLTYIYTGKPDKAVEIYEQALRFQPDATERRYIYRNLGMAYAQEGKLGKARAAYLKALEIDPQYGEAYVSLGNLAFNRGDYKGAVETYGKAAEAGADDASVYLKLGVSYFNIRNYDSAITHLQKAVRSDSLQTDAYYYLGLACFQDGRYDDAREALEAYVRKEKRISKNSVVFDAKQLLDDLNRLRIRSSIPGAQKKE